MDLVPLHLSQQVVNGLAVGDVVGWPHLMMRRQAGGLGVAVDPAGDVLEVEQTENIVGPVADHGDPGEPGPQEQ